MLVYARNPRGVLHLPDGTRVYGAAMRRSPTEVCLETYETYGECFIDATYRSYDLEKQFGRPFSPIAFRLSELDHLPYDTLRKLGSEIGVLDGRRYAKVDLVRAIRFAIRYGTANCKRCTKTFSRGHQRQVYCTDKCMRKANRGT